MKRNPRSPRKRTKLVHQTIRLAPARIELLRDVADLLLSHGVTPAQVHALVKSAFAHAAARTARLKNGRISYSRVAARTGLRRAAVRDFIRRGATTSLIPSPLGRLAEGWRTDRDFLDRVGKPRPLALGGKQDAFARLASRYVPDIPKRALIEELTNTGHASIRGNSLHLRRHQNASSLLASKTLQASIRGLLNQLRESKQGTGAAQRQ